MCNSLFARMPNGFIIPYQLINNRQLISLSYLDIKSQSSYLFKVNRQSLIFMLRIGFKREWKATSFLNEESKKFLKIEIQLQRKHFVSTRSDLKKALKSFYGTSFWVSLELFNDEESSKYAFQQVTQPLYLTHRLWALVSVTTVGVFVIFTRSLIVLATYRSKVMDLIDTNPWKEDNAPASGCESESHGFEYWCQQRIFAQRDFVVASSCWNLFLMQVWVT